MNARTRVSAWAAIAIVMFTLGCGPQSSTDKSGKLVTALNDNTPMGQARQAGLMVVAIQKEPARTEAILAAHGTTADAFQELLIKIAEDPELTDAYEAARTGGSS